MTSTLATPRLLISAAHKSSGKTTVTLGLAAALAARGLAVQTFKKGPDYIDPMWLARASGRPCFNLDQHLMHDAELAALFALHAARADIAIVEGNKGLYDGLALDGSNSNAALAARLALPVVLVLDARGMTRGIAPLILGYQAFDRSIRIGGVILNRLGGSRHEAKLRAVIEHYTDVPVLGALHEDERLAVAERHLGLMPDAELADADARVRAIADAVSHAVDLERLLALAHTAPPLSTATDAAPATTTRTATAAGATSVVDAPALPASAVAAAPAEAVSTSGRRSPAVTIAIARDAAFGFYYPDDLAALEAAGARLLPFDLLHDARLPRADGLFIGGGFPETALDALHANAAMGGELRAAVERGLPTYAECGGLMVLARSIRWGDRCVPMAGAIPGDVVMHPRPVGRGYVRLQESADFPWPAADGEPPLAVRHGHEFHHSSLENLDPSLRYAYRVQRGHGVDGERDGIVVHNLLASYAHLRGTGGNRWPQRFVAFVRAQRAARERRGAPSTACVARDERVPAHAAAA